MTTAVIIVSAGRGERAGGGVPKQYRQIAGQPVLSRTLAAFQAHPAIGPIIVVINPADQERFDALGSGLPWVAGGATRTDSVRAGLAALTPHAPDHVLIHDAARPFVSARIISAVIDALHTNQGALPALAMTDALLDAGPDGRMRGELDRDRVHAAQTPQGFRYNDLMAAYEAVGDLSLPDDAAVALRAGLAIHVIPGEAENFKITRPEDFKKAESMLAPTMIVTGQGFDVHRLEPADSMWLCGIEICAGLGLVGHSDADVGLHALTDAILGAAGAGDIGQHFPPSDPQWAGAASDRFLLHACKLLTEAGGALNNVDITLIAERPKIGPHRDAMRSRVSELLDLPLARVNIKATTTEKLGFTGRGEGIAAQAIVTARMT